MTHARSLPFWGVHAAAIAGVMVLGWSWIGFALALALYCARMFFLSVGWHRYFAHRSYRTSRAFQFVLALGGTLCAQKGLLWWVANHRLHHKHADQPGDPHSPLLGGFWWAHAGWFLSGKHRRTEWHQVSDLARYPELRLLDRYRVIPLAAFALTIYVMGGAWALVWGLVSTVLLWHGTFTINSLAHLIGRRTYPTRDDSRNHLGLAILTMGEGWHNNHHHHQRSAALGFHWWQIDAGYYVLVALSWIGLVSDLHRAPPHVVTEVASTSHPGTISSPPP